MFDLLNFIIVLIPRLPSCLINSDEALKIDIFIVDFCLLHDRTDHLVEVDLWLYKDVTRNGALALFAGEAVDAVEGDE